MLAFSTPATMTLIADIHHPAARWALTQLNAGDAPEASFSVVSGDASFRRYYRLTIADGHWIVVESPPEQEDNPAFISVQARLQHAGLPVPAIIAYAPEQGYFLLEDFGDELLLTTLDGANVDTWYMRALSMMLDMFTVETAGLPIYDRRELLRELHIMDEWFADKMLGLQLNAEQQACLDEAYSKLCDAALEQPQGFVHRDYHSRNLMLHDNETFGLIDFQDAVRGPLCYDLVSILKDCYIHWPRAKLDGWLDAFLELLIQRGMDAGVDRARLAVWFDWIGLQRHIKVLGVFARLHLRDGKDGYLKDLPLVVAYVRDVLSRYPEFADLSALFDELLMPRIRQQSWYQPMELQG